MCLIIGHIHIAYNIFLRKCGDKLFYFLFLKNYFFVNYFLFFIILYKIFLLFLFFCFLNFGNKKTCRSLQVFLFHNPTTPTGTSSKMNINVSAAVGCVEQRTHIKYTQATKLHNLK